MKTCTRCGQTKPLSEFNSDKRHKDDHTSECRACHREIVREVDHKRREAEPEKIRESTRRSVRKWRAANPEYSREYWQAHPEKNRANSAKRRALKRKATIGDLTAIARIYDVAANSDHVRCYLCGELIPNGERHVDHIVPLSKGGLHTASNLAIACAACNLSKYAKLPEEVGLLL